MTNRMDGRWAENGVGSVKIAQGASTSRRANLCDAAVVPESVVLTGGMGSATTPCRVLNGPQLRVSGRAQWVAVIAGVCIMMIAGSVSAGSKAKENPPEPPMPAVTPSFYSLQYAEKGMPYPPLPFSPFPEAELILLGDGNFAYDDRAVDYEALREEARLEAEFSSVWGAAMAPESMTYGANDLWLEILKAEPDVTGWTAELKIHPKAGAPQPYYELHYAPRLASTNTSWRYLMRSASTNVYTNVIARLICQEQGYFKVDNVTTNVGDGNLVLVTTKTAQELAESLVPEYVTVTGASSTGEAKFTGHPSAIGRFEGGNSCGLPIDTGVLLSSGPISNAVGPNDLSDAGNDNGFDTEPYDPDGDTSLEDLVDGNETLDAAVLEFDVTSPTAFELKFRFVYASEEYPNWISDYNDPMGIFVKNENHQYTNGAVVPETVLPVSVSSINGGWANVLPATRPEFYVDNQDPSYSSQSPYAFPSDIYNIQYDGMTVLLEAKVPIPANSTRRVKIAIADYAGLTADRNLDSAVFIEGWRADECQ